jgi:putative hemolysin
MAGDQKGQIFQPINIREVVADKNKKVAERLPGFVYNWLERILHLDELNNFLKVSGHIKGLGFADEIISYLNIKFNIEGIENLPKEGRYIFVSNHPLGGLDGVLLLKLLNENAGTTRVLINDFIMAITPLEKWFVPVNKVGGQGRSAIKKIEELYNSKDNALIFPAGLCSRKIDGGIIDLTWQKHFIQKSVQHKLDVVPIYFKGRNSNRFYNIARLRKFFKISFNIEMMYLVDELYKHKNKTFSVHFGKPITHTTFDKKKKPIEWAQYVKDEVYKLK